MGVVVVVVGVVIIVVGVVVIVVGMIEETVDEPSSPGSPVSSPNIKDWGFFKLHLFTLYLFRSVWQTSFPGLVTMHCLTCSSSSPMVKS